MSPDLRPRARGQRTAAPAPGRMTSVMRTISLASPDGPRVPRVALLRGGRIVEERRFAETSSVTIGASEAASFVVRAPFARHVLFERRGDGWALRLAAGMKARVAHAGEIVDVDGDTRPSIDLVDRARGKVVFGDTTLLFELVCAPPPAPRPELPLGVKRGAAVDVRLAILATMSFLLHFGIVGAMYSDWMDPTIGPDRDLVGLVDDLRRLPSPPPEPAPPSPSPEPRDHADDAPSPAPKPGPVATHDPSPRAPSRADAPTSDARAAILANRADEIELSLVAATKGGTAVDGTLARTSDVPAVDLDAAAASRAAARRGDGDLRPKVGGGPIAASGDHGLGKLGRTHGDADQRAGDAGNEPPPPAIVELGPKTTNVPVSDADRVIARLRSRFRKCYEAGLSSDPTMQGKVVVAAKIQPNGEVASAAVASNDGLSPGVAQCIAHVVGGATFTGNGATTTLNVPVTFRHQ